MSTMPDRTPTPVADVLNYLDLSARGFVRLAVIFETIENEAKGDRRLTGLAGAGKHLAGDMEDMIGFWHDAITEGGIRTD